MQRQRKAKDSLKVQVHVVRGAVLHSSMTALGDLPGHVIRIRPIVITFDGEEGMDQGGVTREWIDLLFSDQPEASGVLSEVRNTKMMNFVLKTKELCIKDKEFCIKNDGFCRTSGSLLW